MPRKQAHLALSAADVDVSSLVHRPLTVTQVTALVKRAIEAALPATIHVIGEIRNLKRHSSGHLYLTLKDAASELACVMWRSAAEGMKFLPADGLEVIATGQLTVFERAGRYQLYVRRLEPRGIGALELAFRQLCEKLGQEGLFNPERKRPLPPYPTRLAVVTSPTGAALADILRTIERRFPCVHVLIHPVRVQGPGAAAEIAHAIRRVNAQAERLGGIDAMIVGRGGGSLEDLWAFNEEVVARAVYASRIPVISAVGHEVDVTIADLAADVRAATPTAAAELAVPLLDDVVGDFDALSARMTRGLGGLVTVQKSRMNAVTIRSPFRDPLSTVLRREQIVDELLGRVLRSLIERIHERRRALDGLEPTLRRIAPHAYLLQALVRLRDAEHRLRWAMARRIGDRERGVNALAARFERSSPRNKLAARAEQVRRLVRTLATAMGHRLDMAGESVARQEGLLSALSYRKVLGRGFSITRTKGGKTIVRSVKELKDRQRVVTQTADGEFESEVVNLDQLELFE